MDPLVLVQSTYQFFILSLVSRHLITRETALQQTQRSVEGLALQVQIHTQHEQVKGNHRRQ